MTDSLATTSLSAPPPAKFVIADAGSFADEMIHLPIAARYAVSMCLVALATGLALSVERLVAASNVSLMFVIPVVLSATMFGWGPSLAAVVAGVLAFDFFFTEPKYTFVIASPADIWAAGLLFLTAVIVSAVAAEARRRAEEARQAAARAEALQVLAHMVVEARPRAEILQAGAAALNQIFRAPSAILVEEVGSVATVATAGDPTITKAEEQAAWGALASRLATRSQTYPYPESKFDFWPVADRSGRHAVIGVDFSRADRGRPKAPERFVEVVAGYLAIALRGDTAF